MGILAAAWTGLPGCSRCAENLALPGIQDPASKSFNALVSKGVKEAKPEHRAQMQCYMNWAGWNGSFASPFAGHDRLHLERIGPADKRAAKVLMELSASSKRHAARGISTDPSWFPVQVLRTRRACAMAPAAPLPTCRSYSHSTRRTGRLDCAMQTPAGRWTMQEQKAA